ncbi:hypothetical protein AC249_AIPGENE5723, partial [Exaiptasia diaphana]
QLGPVEKFSPVEKEREFVLECQNLVMGKGWKEVVAIAKQNVIDKGLPQRVVNIYLDAPEQRVTNRIKSVLKKKLADSSGPSTSTSKPIQQANQMQYTTKGTPAERQTRSKLANEFVWSSSGTSDSDDLDALVQEPKSKKRKSDRDVAREAQEEHTEMCTKAMETMERVNLLLTSVQTQINQGK